MLLDLTCPSCGRNQRATDAVFGKIVLCPSCGGSFPVSRPEEAPPAGTDRPRWEAVTAPPVGPARRRRPSPPPRTGPPPWAYAILGGAAALIVGAGIALFGPDRSAAARAPGDGGPPMSTAQIVARCEPSVALVRGKVSSGTGFLIRPGLIATNAHVIDDEFVADLEVRFPSASDGGRGPVRAELLYEDSRRDLAFLGVRSDLPALDLARSYRFTKGEDVTVIGSPGLGEDVVLENAISRGVMSSRTAIDGQDFLQMSISINPGNSGGPIFDPAGRVIGVATLRSSKAESLGFGIPVEDLHAALIRMDLQPDQARAGTASRHRARAAFRMLAGAGAMYAAALKVRAGVLARVAFLGPGTDLLPTRSARALDETLARLERRQLARVDDEIAAIGSDPAMAEAARRGYQDLASNYGAMKDLYVRPSLPADAYASRAAQLRGRHLQLVNSLRADLGFQVPREQLAILESDPQDDPPPNSIAGIGPGPGRPRPGPFGIAPPPFPMGPVLTPGGFGRFDPARDARERAMAMQRRLEEMQQRMQALRPRLGP